jgi:hypothetical protein
LTELDVVFQLVNLSYTSRLSYKHPINTINNKQEPSSMTNRNTILAFIFALIVLLPMVCAAQTVSQVETDSTSNSKVDTDAKTRTIVVSPPPSAIAPSVNSSSSDLCTVGVSGAVQTQILGIAAGETVRDPNCERLKMSKTLYDMGMKVAAVSVLCQDRRVFDAMKMAGTPCPYLGKIGQQAQDAWDENPEQLPPPVVLETKEDVQKKHTSVIGGAVSLGLLLLLL